MIEVTLRHRPCQCAGYWFPHRKGGGACEHATDTVWQRAMLRRYGPPETDPDADIPWDIPGVVWDGEGCPF